MDQPAPIWHSRGYIPHWEAGETAQAITFRLADSLPVSLLQCWEDELHTPADEERYQERRKRIERALDSGHGSRALAEPAIGELVENALLHFDASRYRLHSWVVMPNHVHALATPIGTEKLSAIVHSWKSFTAKKANALLGKAGTFWAVEYFDRAIRDDAHFANAVDYFAMNPVKAGLCGAPETWRFSSAWRGRVSRL
jgi:putative DNA methylase